MDSVGNLGSISSVNLTQPTQITLNYTASNVSCYDSQDGSVTITPSGGASPYDIITIKDGIIFSQMLNVTTTMVLNDLDVGNYVISIKDSNNCTIPNQSFTIQQRPTLNLNIDTIPTTNGYHIPCYGNTITVSVDTSYTYDSTTYTVSNNPIKYYVNDILKTTVTGPSSNVLLTNMSAGTYVIKAEDNAGCFVEKTLTLLEPPMELSVNYGVFYAEYDATGCSGCGMAPDRCRQGIIDINGGVYPYTITWSDGSTLLTSKPGCAGTVLSVTVTDDNGCSVGPIYITL
jgi:hypothetical protein